VEGQSVTLEWTFDLHGVRFLYGEIFFEDDQGKTRLIDKVTDSSPEIDPAFSGRITGNITDSFSSVTFLEVNRNDSKTYEFDVRDFNNRATPPSRVKLEVLCK